MLDFTFFLILYILFHCCTLGFIPTATTHRSKRDIENDDPCYTLLQRMKLKGDSENTDSQLVLELCDHHKSTKEDTRRSNFINIFHFNFCLPQTIFVVKTVNGRPEKVYKSHKSNKEIRILDAVAVGFFFLILTQNINQKLLKAST